MLLVMLSLGALAGLILAAVVTYSMPKIYESSVTIEIRPPANINFDGTEVLTPPNYCATQFEVIKSRNSLVRVIEMLDLTNKWAMDRESVFNVLKAVVITENIQGTDLLNIRVRHPNREDARDVAAEVAQAYKSYRSDIETRTSERRILELKQLVREQEDRMEMYRKIVTVIAEKFESGTEDSSGANAVEQLDLIDAKRDLDTERSSLEKMRFKLVSAEIDHEITDPIIIVHDDPVVANVPILPNIQMNLVRGIVRGALFSPFFALPLMFFLNRRSVAC